jgi:hypothetical protein
LRFGCNVFPFLFHPYQQKFGTNTHDKYLKIIKIKIRLYVPNPAPFLFLFFFSFFKFKLLPMRLDESKEHDIHLRMGFGDMILMIKVYSETVIEYAELVILLG